MKELRQIRMKCDELRRELWQLQYVVDQAHDRLCELVDYTFELEDEKADIGMSANILTDETDFELDPNIKEGAL